MRHCITQIQSQRVTEMETTRTQVYIGWQGMSRNILLYYPHSARPPHPPPGFPYHISLHTSIHIVSTFIYKQKKARESFHAVAT